MCRPSTPACHLCALMCVCAWFYLGLFDWKYLNDSIEVNTAPWLPSLPICSGQGQGARCTLSGCLTAPAYLLSEYGRRMPCHLVAIVTVSSGFPVKSGKTDPYPASQRAPEGLAKGGIAPFFLCLDSFSSSFITSHNIDFAATSQKTFFLIRKIT